MDHDHERPRTGRDTGRKGPGGPGHGPGDGGGPAAGFRPHVWTGGALPITWQAPAVLANRLLRTD